MGSLGRLRHFQFHSALARQILSLFYKEQRFYPLLFGPLAGLRLYYDRSVNYHVILGLWDSMSLFFLNRLFQRLNFFGTPKVVADVGANLGYFSLWIWRQASGIPGTKIYAFEPAPAAHEMLLLNLRENAVKNAEPIACACADRSGIIEFHVGNHHHVSSLDIEWTKRAGYNKRIQVQATTLDDYCFQPGREAPDFIKMDIEGGGIFALYGMDRCVSLKRPLVWMESHTPDEDRAISNFIRRNRYHGYRFTNNKPILDVASVHPDPDGVWGTMLLYPSEMSPRLAQILPGGLE